MALIQLGSVEEAVAALIVSNSTFDFALTWLRTMYNLITVFSISENAQLSAQWLEPLASFLLQVDHLN